MCIRAVYQKARQIGRGGEIMSLLQMSNICKSFGGISVLKNVQLTVEKGEVHALLGENGAGKSTLMNVLTGVFPRDKGEIEFDGNELELT